MCRNPLNEIDRLLGYVCKIDKQILAEPEIHPENTESEYEFTQVMQMVCIDHREQSLVFQNHYN